MNKAIHQEGVLLFRLWVVWSKFKWINELLFEFISAPLKVAIFLSKLLEQSMLALQKGKWLAENFSLILENLLISIIWNKRFCFKWGRDLYHCRTLFFPYIQIAHQTDICDDKNWIYLKFSLTLSLLRILAAESFSKEDCKLWELLTGFHRSIHINHFKALTNDDSSISRRYFIDSFLLKKKKIFWADKYLHSLWIELKSGWEVLLSRAVKNGHRKGMLFVHLDNPIFLIPTEISERHLGHWNDSKSPKKPAETIHWKIFWRVSTCMSIS